MDTNFKAIMDDIGQATKLAAKKLSLCSDDQINTVLADIATGIQSSQDQILSANAVDVTNAKTAGVKPSFLDRLKLDAERIDAIVQSLTIIADLHDPVGQVLETIERPNGLVIEKTSVPIGVLGIIYESRPNVTVDAAALCLKSKNGAILRGGSTSFETSSCLHQIIQNALVKNNLPAETISMIPNTDREMVGAMLEADKYIDVIIPRGGKGLTSRVMNDSRMPVFAHLDGNCHLYIDADVDQTMAIDVIKNAKFRRTGICGATESLLIHEDISDNFIVKLIQMLRDHDCIIAGDNKIQSIHDAVIAATDDDWATEYLDKKISIKIVTDVNEAVSHINQYGSHHTDGILTEDTNVAQTFLNQVDSAIVVHNVSTQFADGGEFGMGAEIGIGTGKLHARGPVGVKQLTTFKYIVKGSGQTRP